MRSDTVFDTHEIARSLTAADLTDAQADAITAAVRRAVEHDAAAVDVDALATKADLKAEVAALEERMAHFATKADVVALEARLEERMTHFATKEDVAALEARMTHFATKADVAALEERMGIKMTAELAGLEARLAWRLVGAGVAIAGIQAAALFALLRMVGTGS